MSLSKKYRLDTIYCRISPDNGATWIDIRSYITDIVPSVDLDRSPFWHVTVTLDKPPQAIIDAADPRRVGSNGRLSFGVYHDVTYPNSTTTTQQLGGSGTTMYTDSATYDWINDQLVIDASSGETRLSEHRNVGVGTQDSAATNLLALFNWAKGRVGGLSATTVDALTPTAASVAIPAGDRRLWQPGETAEDLYTPELSASGGRAFCALDGTWRLANRESPPDQVAGYGTIIANTYQLPTGDTVFAVTAARSTTSRDGWAGGWADGALVHYSYVDGTGARQERWQSEPYASGASRGLLVEIDRAPGASNYATVVASRARQRGSSFEVTGSVNFNVRPGAQLTVRRPSGDVAAGTIRSVEWRLGDDEMTVTTQIGAPT